MNTEQVFQEIMDMGQKVSVETDRIKKIFEKSGIEVNSEMKISGINGDPVVTLKTLMDNLSEMAVVKISAKQVIRKSGISV